MQSFHPCPDCEWLFSERKFDAGYHRGHKKRVRAGVFLHDNKTDKILVVQTYGQHIGLPKGGQERGETLQDTALRELKEESGVVLPTSGLGKKIVIHGNAHYFIGKISEIASTELSVDTFSANDVTGCGWIHIECLCKIKGKITSHLIEMISKVLSRNVLTEGRNKLKTLTSEENDFVQLLRSININGEITTAKLPAGQRESYSRHNYP